MLMQLVQPFIYRPDFSRLGRGKQKPAFLQLSDVLRPANRRFDFRCVSQGGLKLQMLLDLFGINRVNFGAVRFFQLLDGGLGLRRKLAFISGQPGFVYDRFRMGQGAD